MSVLPPTRQPGARLTPVAARLLGIAGLWAVAVAWAWQAPYVLDAEVSLLPWLMGRGWVLYRDLVDQHPPLWPALLALVGGNPGLPLHLVVVGLYAATLALTAGVAGRVAGWTAAAGALALAAFWLPLFDGFHLWYDGALAPVYLGLLAQLRIADCGLRSGDGSRTIQFRIQNSVNSAIRNRQSAIGLGLLLGIGILIKQHAALVAPALVLAGAGNRTGRGGRLLAFSAGLAAPLLAAAGYFAAQGAIGPAGYWIIGFSLTGDYAGQAALAPGPGEWPTLAALYALLLVFLLGSIARRPVAWRVAPALVAGSLLLAATLPAWPRYGRFHFQAAIPLLAVAGGVALVRLAAAWRAGGRGPRLAVLVATGCLLASTGMGLREWAQVLQWQAVLGPPAAPYAATAPPLRAWVDQHDPPGAPLFCYGLDALLYRVLEREPPRPWAPQLPLILRAGDTEARLWAGIAVARPPVVLVPATWWDAPGPPGTEGPAGLLRSTYHEAARFNVVVYGPAPRVAVVGLLPNASGR